MRFVWRAWLVGWGSIGADHGVRVNFLDARREKKSCPFRDTRCVSNSLIFVHIIGDTIIVRMVEFHLLIR